MTTRQENITTIMDLIENWPRKDLDGLIINLLSMLDETTLNLVTRSMEADAVDKAEL